MCSDAMLSPITVGGNETFVIKEVGHLDLKAAKQVPTYTSKQFICLEWVQKASTKMCLHKTGAHGVALLSRQSCCSPIVGS